MGVNTAFNENETTQNEIKDFFETGQKFHKLAKEYAAILLPNAHKQNFHRVKNVYETKGKSWYRFIYSDFRASKKQLLDVLKTKPSSISEQIELANAIVTKSELVEKAGKMKSLAKSIFTEGGNWDFENDEKWLNKNDSVAYIFDVKISRNQGDVNQEILEKLSVPKSTFSIETNDLQAKLSVFESNLNNLVSKLEYDLPDAQQLWGATTPLSDMMQRIVDMSKRGELLNIFCQWNNYKNPILAPLSGGRCRRRTCAILRTSKTENQV